MRAPLLRAPLLRALFAALTLGLSAPAPLAQGQARATLVLDASGSMGGPIDGVHQIVTAHETLATVPADWPVVAQATPGPIPAPIAEPLPQIQLLTPPELLAGESYEVDWQGPVSDGDRLEVVGPDGSLQTHDPATSRPLILSAPPSIGRMTLRYRHGPSGEILDQRTVSLRPAPIALTVPATVGQG